MIKVIVLIVIVVVCMLGVYAVARSLEDDDDAGTCEVPGDVEMIGDQETLFPDL